MNKFLALSIYLVLLISSGCSEVRNPIEKFDEVFLICDNYIVKGTDIPNDEYDLNNGVDVYYFRENDFTKEHNIPINEWRDTQAISASYSDKCKELIRLKNYTKYQWGVKNE